ncbi:unnamed protein product [Penicillium egyptiacum]|uniref:DUF7580 domain-containing protein n=1 Tax=Penicillium egyptiacum TaxID=1303716 RepID=A0A9W4KEQ0_9EURO|nr:unnamed protein product [Penicillium egyptiacum]
MATDDPIDLAQAAISRVADIASSLGVQYKRPVCGRLGAELLLVANYIDTAGLLRDVESICNVGTSFDFALEPELISKNQYPDPISGNGYHLLEAIGQSVPGFSVYNRAQTEIRRGLTCLNENPRHAEQVIFHIQRFTKGDRKLSKRDVSNDTTSKKRWSHPERPRHVNELVHRTLREYVCCTCQESAVKGQMQREHLVRLLLQPPSQQITGTSLIQFDMLFSSTPFWKEGLRSHWQDVELLVPSVGHTSNKKRARFADADQESDDSGHVNPLSAKRLSRVDRGQFCNLIALEANSRLRLSIQDGQLHHCFEPLRQLVNHVPGISLADILRKYYLTARMKLVLAYIIAYSVWQYYDSDWMKTKWTSDTIQFMKESGNNERSDERPKLITWKPYLSVQFNNEDPECYEFNKLVGGVHDYPRIRALGIMLVEIGIGSPLHKGEPQSQPLVAKEFDYPDYMSAVSHCLDPGTFNLAPFVAGSTPRERKENLQLRKDSLYDKVVFPLEELLQGTKWMEDLTKIAPLEVPSKVTAFQSPPSLHEDIVERTIAKKKRTKSERKASEWLARLNHFNRELAQIGPAVGLSTSPRVRIAILDTGYDDNAPFFFSPDVNPRLKGWKDCVNESDELMIPTDTALI